MNDSFVAERWDDNVLCYDWASPTRRPRQYSLGLGAGEWQMCAGSSDSFKMNLNNVLIYSQLDKLG